MPQAQTAQVRLSDIISDPYLIAGMMDRREAKPFRKEYDNWLADKQHLYEVGRQIIALYPKFTYFTTVQRVHALSTAIHRKYIS